jgi:hypothetical protein
MSIDRLCRGTLCVKNQKKCYLKHLQKRNISQQFEYSGLLFFHDFGALVRTVEILLSEEPIILKPKRSFLISPQSLRI